MNPTAERSGKADRGDGPWRIRVRRQTDPGDASTRRWEQFEVERAAHRTVADLLRAINERPRTAAGEPTTAIAWGPCAPEPPCGGCAMRIDGHAALACRTTVEELGARRRCIVLEPLGELPLLVDLRVDRAVLARNASQLGVSHDRADHDDTQAREASPDSTATSPAQKALSAELARCTGCGLCLEACPEYRRDGRYLGAAAFVEAELAVLEGRLLTRAWRQALLGPAAIARCGQSYNCMAICPEAIGLDGVIARAHRTAARHWLGSLLNRHRR